MRAAATAAASAIVLVGVAVGGCRAGETQVGILGVEPAPVTSPSSTAHVPPHPAASGTGPATHPPKEHAEKGTEAWRVSRPATDHQIEGYATRISGVPGTRLGLKVSTRAARYRVTAYRIGAYTGGTGHPVWHSALLRGEVQADAVLAPAETRTVVAPWHRSVTVDTDGWRPGFYVFALHTVRGFESLVPYVVSSESAAGTVALVAPATTWQAYNRWGGYSLYDGAEGDRRAWAVSFDRPFVGAPGANDFRTATLPIAVEAERLGLRLSYFADVDLEARPGLLDGARAYASLGHDEYWTNDMRRAVMTARDAGTNVAFLGANTMYWRVRLADRPTGPDRLVVGYRYDAWQDPVRDTRPAEVTGRFRDAPVPRSERDLVGMEYECYPVDAPFRVVSPGWWGFRGTGAEYGEEFPGLVGLEADRVYPGEDTPHPLQVLSHTTYSCRGVTTSSQSVYYTVSSGAGVFTAGTLRWGCALVDRCEHALPERTTRFATRVTANVLRTFARGPAGRHHPARDNVDDFALSPVNSVDAS